LPDILALTSILLMMTLAWAPTANETGCFNLS